MHHMDTNKTYRVKARWELHKKFSRCLERNLKAKTHKIADLRSLAAHLTNYSRQKMLYFDLRPGPKILFQGNTPEGSDTFQWPVIERDRVGGLRLMRWDKVKVPLCHYSDAPEESNL